MPKKKVSWPLYKPPTTPERVWRLDSGSHYYKSGKIDVVVHWYVGYPPETLFVSTHPEIGIGMRRLMCPSTELEAAKAEALKVVDDYLNDLLKGWKGK